MKERQTNGTVGRILGSAGALLLGVALLGSVAAQEASPVAGTPAAGGGHPGHIHTGTCEQLGDVVAPLPTVSLGVEATAATPVASPMAGASGALPAAAVSTTVDLSLSDLLASPHAINYHASAEDIGTYIACGAIGGTPDAEGNLFVGLGELNDSGVSGIAWLMESGTQTVVTVFLSESGAMIPADAATPAAAAAQPVAVDLLDIAFKPTTLSIAANSDVTVNLTNSGKLPHNFRIDALGIDVDLAAGANGTASINAPAGTYEYYCDEPGHKEAGMVGTLTVQ